MRIKRFIAPDMRTALKRVRDEQGPDAVILSNRPCEGGIEVVAATDYDEALVAQALRAAGITPAPAPAPAPSAEPAPALHALEQATAEPVDARTLFAAPAAPAAPVIAHAALVEAAPVAAPAPAVAALPATSRFEQMMAALGAPATAPAPPQAPLQAVITEPAAAAPAPAPTAARAVFTIDARDEDIASISPAARQAAAATPVSFAAALQSARLNAVAAYGDTTDDAFDTLSATEMPAPRAPAPFVLELEPMEHAATAAPRARLFDVDALALEPVAETVASPAPAIDTPPVPVAAAPVIEAAAPIATPVEATPAIEPTAIDTAVIDTPAIAIPRLQLVTAPAEDPMLTAMRVELASMREVIERQMGQFALERLRGNPARACVFDTLQAYGCDEGLARSIAERIDGSVEPAKARALMLAEFARMLTVQRTEAIDEGGVIALIGPTGAGKTTTAAKLAARFAARHRARDVALVTTDTDRAGAREQLQAHGRRLGVTVCEAHGAEGLQQTLAQLADYPLVIVDTAGHAPRDRALMGQIAWLRSTPNLRSLLVLPANANPHDMGDAVRRYRMAQPSGVVLTKLDEAGRLGAALGVAVAHDLSLAYVADGQQVPGDLDVADPSRLVLALEKNRRAADNPLMTEHRDAVA